MGAKAKTSSQLRRWDGSKSANIYQLWQAIARSARQ